MQALPPLSSGVPAPQPHLVLPGATTPAPAPSPGQTLVATLDLAGQGLSPPLSAQDTAALLATVNKTLASQGATVSSITLGQVKVGENAWKQGP